MWEKIKAWVKDKRETIVWARVQMLGGAVAAGIYSTLSDPAINEAIKSMLSEPLYVLMYIVVAGVLTEVLRRFRATDN